MATRTFGLREMAVAGEWFGDHDIYRFKWASIPKEVKTRPAFTFETKTAIILDHPHVANVRASESSADLSASLVASDAMSVLSRGIERDLTLVGSKKQIGFPAAVKKLIKRSTLHVYTDSARAVELAPNQYTFNPTTAEIAVKASSGVEATDTVYLRFDLTQALVVFESSASVADGDNIYSDYDAGLVLNVRGYNDMVKTRTDVFVADTIEECVNANKLASTSYEISAGSSAPTLNPVIYEGVSPEYETSEPHSPTMVIVYPGLQTANPNPADGDNIIIRIKQATVCEVAQIAAPNTLQFAEVFTTGDMLGADRIFAHISRLDAVNATGNLEGLELDVMRIMHGHDYGSKGSAPDKMFFMSMMAGQSRPVFRIVGKAVDSRDRGMGWTKIYNCKIESADVEFNDGAFSMRNTSGMGYRNIDTESRRVVRYAVWDQDRPLDLDLI